MIDEIKLHKLIGQMLGDLGGASSVAMVRIGDRLGLYKALHDGGAVTCEALAKRVKLDERYLREWLSHQTASGYLAYDPKTATFSLLPEQAMVFAVEDSPVYMQGGFDAVAAMLENQPKVQAAFKTGGGVAWGDQATCMFCAVARFFRPGYVNSLVSQWLPALDGVVAKLERGAKVADVGCGHGWSTMLMARRSQSRSSSASTSMRARSPRRGRMRRSTRALATRASRSPRRRSCPRRTST